MIFSGLFLFGLIKLLDSEAGSPWLCAGIFGVIKLLSGLLFKSFYFGENIFLVILAAAIITLVSYGYFLLIERTGGAVRWIIAVIGGIILIL